MGRRDREKVRMTGRPPIRVQIVTIILHNCYEQITESTPLRSDSPVSIRDYVIYAPNEGNIRAWMKLMSVLQTGELSFAAANGCEI
jgi:hypothetical protein